MLAAAEFHETDFVGDFQSQEFIQYEKNIFVLFNYDIFAVFVLRKRFSCRKIRAVTGEKLLENKWRRDISQIRGS